MRQTNQFSLTVSCSRRLSRKENETRTKGYRQFRCEAAKNPSEEKRSKIRRADCGGAFRLEKGVQVNFIILKRKLAQEINYVKQSSA
jgi:hypothetical protein